MGLDLICLGIAAGFALVGAIGGTLAGLVHLAAVAVAALLALTLGDDLGGWLAAQRNWPAAPAQMVAQVAIFFPTAMALHSAGLRATKRWRGADKSGASRLAGAAMGFLAGAAISFVALCAVVFMEEPVPGFSDGWRFETRKSSLAPLARRYGPLVKWSYTDVSSLRQALRAALDPGKLGDASDSLAVLAQDPRLKALAADKALRKAVEAGDDLALLRRKEVQALLADPEVLMKLERIRR